MADPESIVPYYVSLDEAGQRAFLESCGLRERDDIIIFGLICEQAAQSGSPVIFPEKFAPRIVDWAEKNNYTRLRLIQNCKRSLSQQAMILREKKVCETHFEGADIRRIILTDPNLVLLQDAYRELENEATADFPMLEHLKFQTGPDQVISFDLRSSDFSKIPEYIQDGKICRIETGEPGKYVLCPPEKIPEMQNLCLKKIRMFLNPATRSKLIEDLTKDMQYLMPEKTSNADKIIRVFNAQEPESAAYFMNLANRLASILNIDREKKGILPVLLAAKMLELIKVGEVNSNSQQESAKQRSQDIARILDYMAGLPRAYTRSDLLQIQPAVATENPLSQHYESQDFSLLVQEMLETSTVFRPDLTESERQYELLPMLTKIKTPGGEEYFLHRKSIGAYLEAERRRLREELHSLFLNEWYNLMLNGKSKPQMKFDDTFNFDLRKYVEQKSPLFVSLLVQAQTVYNALFISVPKTSTNMLVGLYFYPGSKPLVRSYHEILQISRGQIFDEVMYRLPWFIKFPFLRWLLSLFGITFGNPKAELLTSNTEVKKPEGVSRSGTDALRKAISELEKNLSGGEQISHKLSYLENKWNIKIGTARDQFKDKIDQQVSNRAKRLFVVLQRVPELQASFLHREIANMAAQVVSGVKDEVREKDALKQYIELKALSLYHNRSY